jgi:hypothetical protein
MATNCCCPKCTNEILCANNKGTVVSEPETNGRHSFHLSNETSDVLRDTLS